MHKKTSLRKFNNSLTVVNILLALYILFLPLMPMFTLWWQSFAGSQPPLVRANTASTDTSDRGSSEEIPKENTLVIPRINLQQVIHEGADASVLSKGVWRRPHTSVPSGGSNTVLVGHRFSYSDPAVFYHLDKIKNDDQIVLYWEGTKYRYQVEDIKIVDPSATEVEDSTEEPILTVYTCTPLWSAKNRLVVQARLLE